MTNRKKCVKDIKFNNYCTVFQLSDTSNCKVGLATLEKLWNESMKANKKPLIVLGVRRNDNELFMITGEVKLEPQRRKK